MLRIRSVLHAVDNHKAPLDVYTTRTKYDHSSALRLCTSHACFTQYTKTLIVCVLTRFQSMNKQAPGIMLKRKKKQKVVLLANDDYLYSGIFNTVTHIVPFICVKTYGSA